jgi:hypothetical protein
MIIVGTIIIVPRLGVPQNDVRANKPQQAPGCRVKQAIRQMIPFCMTTDSHPQEQQLHISLCRPVCVSGQSPASYP